MSALVDVQDICKVYNPGENEVWALDHVSVQIHEKEFVAIIGQSGSGKSTLLNMLGGLDRPDEGTVQVDGVNIFTLKDEELTIFRRRKIGFVFQNYNLVPSLNVYENIVLPVRLDGREPDQEYLDSIIDILGLSEKLQNLPNNLSGGQQQRVAIARALINRPKLLLLDEHTAALDPKTAEIIMELTDRIVREKGLTAIMVTHNLRYAVEYGSRMLMMHKGNVILDKAGEEKAAVTVADLLATFNDISIECGN